MVSPATLRFDTWRRLLVFVTLTGTAFAIVDSHSNAAPAPDPLRDLLKALKNKDEKVRAKAASELGKWREKGAPAVPGLLKALKDPCPLVRRSAAGALYDITGKKYLTSIVKALEAEEDPDVRFYLVTIVRQWGLDRGEEAKEIVPALIETMKLDYEKYSHAVESSWVALIVIGPKAVPALVELAKDTNQNVINRMSAIDVL
jgi:HEAT repeat protein